MPAFAPACLIFPPLALVERIPMRTFRRRATTILTAFLVWVGAASTSNAQFFIGASNSDRQLLPGAIIPTTGRRSRTAMAISRILPLTSARLISIS